MQTTNDVYRRVAKQFHPDTVLSPGEKAVLSRLMVEINAARESNDIDVLLEIEMLGPAYLATQQFAQVNAGYYETDYADPPPQPFRNRTPFWKTLMGAIHPYALWSLLGTWHDHGPVRKLTTLSSALGWTFLMFQCWAGLDGISAIARVHGYAHESVSGLIIVLLRGLLILVSLRFILPLLVVILLAGVFCGAAYVCALVLASIAGYFHPMLGIAANMVVGAFVLFGGWVFLNKQ